MSSARGSWRKRVWIPLWLLHLASAAAILSFSVLEWQMVAAEYQAVWDEWIEEGRPTDLTEGSILSTLEPYLESKQKYVLVGESRFSLALADLEQRKGALAILYPLRLLHSRSHSCRSHPLLASEPHAYHRIVPGNQQKRLHSAHLPAQHPLSFQLE